MMRPALVLLALCPALASANPTDGLEREVGATTGGAFTRGGGEARRTNDAATVSTGDRDAAPSAGNPLWAIPLSSLSATRERPLFSASRRPASLAAPAEPPKDEAPPPPPATAVERPQLELIGTIVGSGSRIALLKAPGSEAPFRLRIGEESAGWRVQSIDLRSIAVKKLGQTVIIDLPKSVEGVVRPTSRGR